MPKYQTKRTQKPTYPINNTEQGIEIPHEISEDASGIANIEILTISKHSTYSNHYVKKKPNRKPTSTKHILYPTQFNGTYNELLSPVLHAPWRW